MDFTDISLDVPDVLDLSMLRGIGRQEGEQDFPADEEETPEVVIDATVVAQLVEMGFAEEGCKKVRAAKVSLH